MIIRLRLGLHLRPPPPSRPRGHCERHHYHSTTEDSDYSPRKKLHLSPFFAANVEVQLGLAESHAGLACCAPTYLKEIHLRQIKA